ncbi:MAG: sulfatase-like hydrolase/transferase [Paludibacter sp.]|nr:sulfatase-like hydrolase/transferase [Paludibacter sp.]
MRKNLKIATACLLVCPATFTNAQTSTNKKPNLIFVFADQWRKQALGYRNQDPVQTPNLDKFASWAFSFNNAFSSNPVSGPNRACLFTGKYTINNGVFANNVPLDPNEESSLGKICKAAGYSTAYIGKWHLNGEVEQVEDKSRRQGFDFWVQSLAHNPFSQKYYIAEENKSVRAYQRGEWAPTYETQVGIDFIEKNKEKPFCLVISYNPPHTSGGLGFEDRSQPAGFKADGTRKLGYGYGGPKEYEALYKDKDYAHFLIRKNIKNIKKTNDNCFDVIPGYFGAITAIDNDFGNLMNYLEKNNLLENTIVVFTADHGESMGSHGLMTKGTWFEESVGIPLIIGWKGKTIQKQTDEVINSIDFMPTLLGMMKLSIPKTTDGTDYSSMLLGGKFKAPEYAFLTFNFGGIKELKHSRYWRCIYSKQFSYILCGMNQNRSFTNNKGYVLYDLQKDPYQMQPIFKGMGYDKEINMLHTKLAEELKRTDDPFIEKYWNQSASGFPQLNKYTISSDYMKSKLENSSNNKGEKNE